MKVKMPSWNQFSKQQNWQEIKGLLVEDNSQSKSLPVNKGTKKIQSKETGGID